MQKIQIQIEFEVETGSDLYDLAKVAADNAAAAALNGEAAVAGFAATPGSLRYRFRTIGSKSPWSSGFSVGNEADGYDPDGDEDEGLVAEDLS